MLFDFGWTYRPEVALNLYPTRSRRLSIYSRQHVFRRSKKSFQITRKRYQLTYPSSYCGPAVQEPGPTPCQRLWQHRCPFACLRRRDRLRARHLDAPQQRGRAQDQACSSRSHPHRRARRTCSAGRWHVRTLRQSHVCCRRQPQME